MVVFLLSVCFVFFFKQKTAYDMRISGWSSDVCSSDLFGFAAAADDEQRRHVARGDICAKLDEELARVVERADRAPIDLVARNPVAEIERRQIDRPGYGRGARRLGLGDLQGDRKSTRLNSSH